MGEPSPPENEKKEIEPEYANNVYLDPSIWDLKLIFGELSPSLVKQGIDWHTSITLPWAQAKLLNYYLELNIAVQELRNGPIPIPPTMLPPEPTPPAEGSNEEQAVVKLIKERRHKFLENLKNVTS